MDTQPTGPNLVERTGLESRRVESRTVVDHYNHQSFIVLLMNASLDAAANNLDSLLQLEKALVQS